MARILLSAYACEPGRGSEPGVGWTWATELARLGHQVTVITRACNQLTIENESQRLREQLGFVYFDLPAAMQRWRRLPGGKSLYYVLWQWLAVRHIRQLFPSLPFDVVHHVTYVSARYPSFMGSLGLPFWFGPVSGGEGVPPRLRAGFSASQRLRERLRDISNRMVRVDPLMRRTFRLAEKIFVTRDTLAMIPCCWQPKSTVQLAVGLPEQGFVSAMSEPKEASGGLRLLYVGRLLEWKGVDIVLRAVDRLRHSVPGLTLMIIGQGRAKARLVRLSRRLRLDDLVTWVEWLPQPALKERYGSADVLLFPSLRDSGGMVVLEAMANGLPVISTDLGGPGIIVNSRCGRVLSTRRRTPEQLAEDMAEALAEVIAVPHLLESLSHGARARAREFHFQKLVASVYSDVSSPEIAWEA